MQYRTFGRSGPQVSVLGFGAMRIPTQANHMAWQQRLLAKWRVDYNSPDMDMKAITCDGCRGPRTDGYCAECQVRACAMERGHPTCADCPDYACTQLENFFSMAPTARDTLELLRLRH